MKQLLHHGKIILRPLEPDDIDLLYQMYAHTALRDGFTIRGKAY